MWKSVLAGVMAATLSVGWAQAQQVSAEARKLAESNNGFACDLYGYLAKQDGNLFFSPYSISTALGMTYAGARNQTAVQMAATLHFPFENDKLHKAFGDLTRYLNAQGEKRPFELSVANALWAQKGFTFRPEYLRLVKENYDAESANVDFIRATEEARQRINAWVEKKTNGRIKDLIPKGSLNAMTRLVLTNAIYFKSAWQHKFQERFTKPETFTTLDGSKVQAPTMHKSERTLYYKGKGFAMASLPYKYNALSMVVLLPDRDSSLAKLESRLTAENLSRWLRAMKRYQVDVKLPKFKTTAQFKLKDVLAKMGMPIAFSSQADFSGMTTQGRLFIQDVIHKAFVDVHEKGTEAAAATAVLIGRTSVPAPLPRVDFHVDRPFVFLIRDNATGSILFMGRIVVPESK